MKRHQNNAKWLMYIAVVDGTSIAAAYLTPFFLAKGLSLAQIFTIQSMFSIAVLLWEIPSGWLADKIGRAFSLKLSCPIAAIGMMAYGLSNHFWQFLVCELILAIACGMVSGVDTALLYDSLKAENQEDEYTKLKQRLNALGFLSAAVCGPLSYLLVKYGGVGATLVAEGAFYGVGTIFALKLVDAPHVEHDDSEKTPSAWGSIRNLVVNPHVCWLLALGTALSLATYLSFWLSAVYYASIGIPVAIFGAILALRSLFKAAISHFCNSEKHVRFAMLSYAVIAGTVYVAMASQLVWLVLAVLGHDVIQALHGPPISARLNAYMHDRYRATANSATSLVGRIVYAGAGPMAGLAVDRAGLQSGMLYIGASCSAVALVAIWRLHKLKTFSKGGD